MQAPDAVAGFDPVFGAQVVEVHRELRGRHGHAFLEFLGKSATEGLEHQVRGRVGVGRKGVPVGDADAVHDGTGRRWIESRQKFGEDFKVVRNEKRRDAFREKTARDAQGDARIAEIVDDAAENLYGSGLHGSPFGRLSRYNTRVSGVRAGTPFIPEAHD